MKFMEFTLALEMLRINASNNPKNSSNKQAWSKTPHLPEAKVAEVTIGFQTKFPN
jgi:hypothetical protein